jgi:hypothetical protein
MQSVSSQVPWAFDLSWFEESSRLKYSERREFMEVDECARPKCKCKAIPGIAISNDGKNYCSDHCAKAGSQDFGKCECGHPGCVE